MEKEITSFKIFSNSDEKAQKIAKKLQKEMIFNGFLQKESGFDLAIAVGGDGSFLRMVKENNFNDDVFYVGVNAGTLGFLQEIKPDEISEFIQKLKVQYYKIEETGIQETVVDFDDGIKSFYSLNEVVIREAKLKTAYLDVFINDVLLENFVGDGLLISTSCGSTAYNLSFGGSVVYNDLHTLQITPIAPLNSKAYKSLINSIIVPENKLIKIIPTKIVKDLHLVVDGENIIFENVKSIQTKTANKKIKILRLSVYDYTKVINEKFLN